MFAKRGLMLSLEVERAIRQSWLRVRNQILSDPQELHRRLARRRLKSLTRPPRAWCIAIRASDRRITPAHWIISPEHAMDLNHPERSEEHTSELQSDSDLVCRLLLEKKNKTTNSESA